MQRLPLVLRRVALLTLTERGLAPACRLASGTPGPTGDQKGPTGENKPNAQQVVLPKPEQYNANFFKLERIVFVGALPLVPLSYFVHGTTMDWLLAAAIIANCHFGGHAVITDYARPILVGETVARMKHALSYVLSVLVTVALFHFNYNDVGLTRAFELVFSL